MPKVASLDKENIKINKIMENVSVPSSYSNSLLDNFFNTSMNSVREGRLV